MLLLNGKKEIDVKDIYATIQFHIDLFANTKDGKTDAPAGNTDGNLFLLRDGTLHFSNEKTEYVTMDILSEQ